MKRFLTLFAYRLPYSTHKRNLFIFYTVLTALLILSVTMGALAFTYPNTIFPLLSLISFAVTTLGVLVVVVYARIVAAAKADYEIAKEYFSEETHIYNEAILKSLTDHMLRKKGTTVAIAAIVLRGQSSIRNTFGQSAIQTINTAIKKSIIECISSDSLYYFGYSPIKGFIIVKKTSDTDIFVEELRHVGERTNYYVTNQGTLPEIAVLSGVALGGNETNYEAIYNKASTASTYNLGTRVMSDTIVFNEEYMNDNEGEKALSNELGKAINEEQLQIFYQPKFDLKTDKFYGAEALVRWNHPARGLLPPSLFVPFAEQSNRIVDIDMYVFEHVCRDITKWRSEGKRTLTISINLSRKTALDPNILNFYKETMEKYDIDPKWIDIELTESMASQDALFVGSIIRKIKAMNVETSIDDFGTGYSSFSSLKKIPFDTLKIDKSFIDEVELDQKSRDIVRCINEIGHSLGMKTLAEGIETENQVNIAREIGIDGIQGYYFSRPLSEFEYQRFLNNNEFEKNEVKEAKA